MKHIALALFVACGFSVAAHGEVISNPIAVFDGLDKIMGQTTSFEVKIGEEKKFGGLIVKTDVCNTSPITERPKTVAFVEVDEQSNDGKRRRIFSGWMFAESPGLNAVEHPLYDVWLTACRDPNAPPPLQEQAPVAPGQKPAPDDASPD